MLARLGNTEGSADDLQASISSLGAAKQDNLENANVVGGHPVRVGSVLNKVGTKDNALTVETSGSIIKLGVDQTVTHDNPAFAGTVSGVSKSMVGLGSVGNTRDVDKPVSTSTQN